MSIFLTAALALTQLAQLTEPQPPEIEALLRHRDEKRRADADTVYSPAPTTTGTPPSTTPVLTQDDRAALAAVVPPGIADKLADCLARANVDPADGVRIALAWDAKGGGAYAAQCHGYALGRAERWTESADAFERGAAASDLDVVTKARLWSQAGNAALIAGNSARAVRDLDTALAAPLPATLATGEIHLDRARARVAANDLKGARTDLDQAIVLAKDDPLAWLLSATLARRMNDLPLARTHIEQAAARARDDAAIALEQGVIYALSGDRDAAARAALKRAQELASKDSDVQKQASDYLAQLGPEPASAPGKAQPEGR
ncbi:hypothetical protein [Sphingobium nicotianae]|uniref:Tetratricopeptide repeat protein n=1 Tax=Sphingobium nicotianae TaxID=2782607 RepID=A0A9X1DA95_9SPHN|nr:hypothetical protein [Sphingobium nicotianae]MBT2186281.1 hypothetical protein [Sphingobium nicotianae]